MAMTTLRRILFVLLTDPRTGMRIDGRQLAAHALFVSAMFCNLACVLVLALGMGAGQ